MDIKYLEETIKGLKEIRENISKASDIEDVKMTIKVCEKRLSLFLTELKEGLKTQGYRDIGDLF